MVELVRQNFLMNLRFGRVAFTLKQLYEQLSSESLIWSDFTDPPGAKVTPNLHGVTAGAGAFILTNPIVVGFTDHPGIWLMTTGTTAAGRAFVLSGGGGLTGSYHVGVGGVTRIGTWLRTESLLSTAAERYTLRAGFSSIALPNVINEGITFEYIDNENGGRWQGLCEDGVGETSVDTGVLVTASTWYKLEIEINAAGTSVEFFIDDLSVGTVAANIPSGTGFGLFYNMHILKTIGLTSRATYIDAMYLYQEISR